MSLAGGWVLRPCLEGQGWGWEGSSGLMSVEGGTRAGVGLYAVRFNSTWIMVPVGESHVDRQTSMKILPSGNFVDGR